MLSIWEKMKLGPYLTPYTTSVPSILKEYTVKGKPVDILEGNAGDSIWLWGKDILSDTKRKTIKEENQYILLP